MQIDERKAVGLVDVKLADKAGEFSGYGAVFGNVDSYGDVIQQGAFKQTLDEWKARGKLPKMLLQHGGMGVTSDDMMPIGQWTGMEENEHGLKVKGRLFALNTERGQYVYEGLKSGELDSLSIGYMVRDFTRGTRADEPERTLTNIDLWEVSIVTFPANDKALISSVKHMTHEQLRDLEAILRDEGLSQRDAKAALSGFRKWSQRDAGAPINTPRDEVVPEAAAVLEALERHSDSMWSEVFRAV